MNEATEKIVQKILDSIVISSDPKEQIRAQLGLMDCRDLRNLMICFSCSIEDLTEKVAAYKLGKSRL